jgi:hypothetical protein
MRGPCKDFPPDEASWVRGQIQDSKTTKSKIFNL